MMCLERVTMRFTLVATQLRVCDQFITDIIFRTFGKLGHRVTATQSQVRSRVNYLRTVNIIAGTTTSSIEKPRNDVSIALSELITSGRLRVSAKKKREEEASLRRSPTIKRIARTMYLDRSSFISTSRSRHDCDWNNLKKKKEILL